MLRLNKLETELVIQPRESLEKYGIMQVCEISENFARGWPSSTYLNIKNVKSE